MRKTVLFLALVVALANQSLFAQVPSYVPTNGLVGYWPFNNNANDESGNGNNGTLMNGVLLTTDRFNNSNSAYSFDGIDDFIKVLDNNIFHFGTQTSFSCSFWIKYNSNLSLNTIISKETEFNPGNGYQIMLMSDKPRFDFMSDGPSAIDFQGNNELNDNNWHFVVLTANRLLNQMVFYVDGILNNSLIDNKLSTGDITNSSNLKFGAARQECVTSNCYYNGKLDDIAMYNRVLTQEEITNLYNSVSSNECLTMTINTGVLSTNPVTYTSSVSIYPNPANDQITIDCGTLANVSGWSIKITNMQGQEVFSQPMNTQQYVVPLNTWSGQGMYFVKIINAQNEVVNIKKIILQ